MKENHLNEDELMQIPMSELASIFEQSQKITQYYRGNYSESLPEYVKDAKDIIQMFSLKGNIQLEFIKRGYLSLDKGLFNLPTIAYQIMQSSDISIYTKLSNADKERLMNFAITGEKYEEILANIMPSLNSDKQKKYIEQNPKLMKYTKEYMQIEFIKENPAMLRYAKDNIQVNFINNKKEMLRYARTIIQERFIQKKPEMFKFADATIQIKYMQENPEYINIASKEAKKKFVQLDKKNIAYLDSDFQRDLVKDDINLYNYCSQEGKDRIQHIYFDRKISDLYKDDIRMRVGYILVQELNSAIEKYNLKITDINAIIESINDYGSDIEKYKSVLNLISCKSVMEKISGDDLTNYISSGMNYDCIVDIVRKCFDETSIEIVEDRTGLTMRDIPNFDIFDSNIREAIGYGGVHAFLTYDMESASIITKLANNPILLENYKKYIELIGDFYPNSAIGLEDKLLSFDKHQELLKELFDNEVSKEDKDNLLLMLRDEEIISEEHENIEIGNIEELKKYKELRIQRFNEEIASTSAVEEKKKLILLKYFGRVGTTSTDGYSDKYEHAKFLQDYLTFNRDEFSGYELDCIELYSIIEEIQNPNILDEINKYLDGYEGISPVDMKQIDSKVIESYKKEYLDAVFTIQDAQRLAEEDENSYHYIQKNNGAKVYRDRTEYQGKTFRHKMNKYGEMIFQEESIVNGEKKIQYTKNGIIGDYETEFDEGIDIEYDMRLEDGDYEVYELDKIDKRLSVHFINGRATYDSYINFTDEEGIKMEKEQEHAINSISVRYDMNRAKRIDFDNVTWLGYTEVNPNSIIGHNSGDANTTHAKKSLRISMANKCSIDEILTTIPRHTSELAILRYEYDLSKIMPGTKGGKKIADFIMKRGIGAEKFAIGLSRPLVRVRNLEKSRLDPVEKREIKRTARSDEDKIDAVREVKAIKNQGDER